MSEKNMPPVTVLGPITPSVDSVRAEVLEYGTLDSSVEKHAPYEYERMRQFFETEEGTLEEEKAARSQAMQYLLFTAGALSRAVTSQSRELWSSRYTNAASELYGAPDAERAQELFGHQEVGVEINHPFADTAERLGLHLGAVYGHVFDALHLEDAPDLIEPDDIADRFEAALEVLAADHDPAWSEWGVDRPDTDKLMVMASKKMVQVGTRRAPVTPMQLKELFTHEVLVHAARAINGAKQQDVRLRTGLPGYLEAEEGLGIFSEYAISGSVKDIVVDRYVDIAYALGYIDGETHTRKELVARALHRSSERSARAMDGKTPEMIAKEVYAHVNRIYRGSRGDDHVGVFTKDIAYFEGFLKVGAYIEGRLAAGAQIEEVWAYLMSGKFDPTDERHTVHITSATA